MANKNFIVLTFAFLLIFMGFDTSQQYLSSIFYTKNIELISFISLSLIYLAFAISTLFSPSICRKLGLKKSLFLASLFYPLFIISTIIKSEILLYFASIVLGIAASLIWTAHGIYFVKITNEQNRGFRTGLFFSLLPLGTALVVFCISFFVETINYTIIYFILFCIALIGSLSILSLTDTGQTEKYALKPFQVIVKKRMLCLIPFMFSSSFIFGLMISSIPIQITNLFGLHFVGKLASIFILSIVIVPIVIGKLSDKIGVKKFVYLSTYTCAFGLLLILKSTALPLFIAGVILIAFSFATFQALSYPIISRLFPQALDSAMAIRWMMMGLAVFASTILSAIINISTLLIIGIIISIISLISTKSLFPSSTKSL